MDGNILQEEIKIPVPWGHISGKWWGPKDKQPIIALHAWQDNCGTYDTLVPLLSVESILCLDLPGHGLSSYLPEGECYYVFWNGVIHLRRIIKHFKWQKVKLMGHSMGGAISFLYAAIYPDEVELVISLDAASSVTFCKNGAQSASELIPQMGPNINQFFNLESTMKKRNISLAQKDMINLVHDAYNGDLSNKSAEILMRRGMKSADKQNYYTFTRDPRLNLFHWGFISLDLSLDFAKKIKCPYLNIKAEPGFDYEENSYKLVLNEISKVSSKFEFHQVQGPHHVHLNDPEKIAPIINNFLQSYK